MLNIKSVKSNKKTFEYILLMLNILFSSSLYSALKSPINHADYIIISPSEFSDALIEFVHYKNSNNLNTLNICLDSIYAEFPDSLSQANSIRNFISYAIQFWQTPPKYCLLAGGINHIPSFQFLCHVDSILISIDEWYSINKYNQYNIPEIALGRFPARNENELINMVHKSIQFDGFHSYENQFLFVADYDSTSFGATTAFENCVDDFIHQFQISETCYSRIDLRKTSPYYGTETDIFNVLNHDVLYFSYYGHGHPLFWSKSHIMKINEIDTFLDNQHPFILTAAACNQIFDDPLQKSLIETLMSFETKGTVAIIGSAGLNFLYNESSFLDHFYSQIFNNSNTTLGDAFLTAKCSLENEREKEEGYIRRITLLGDPSLKLPLGNMAEIEIMDNNIPHKIHLSQNYPNPFNSETTIGFNIKQPSFVVLKIYNIKGQEIATLVKRYCSSGNHLVIWQPGDLSSGLYFYKLQAGNLFKIKKLIFQK